MPQGPLPPECLLIILHFRFKGSRSLPPPVIRSFPHEEPSLIYPVIATLPGRNDSQPFMRSQILQLFKLLRAALLLAHLGFTTATNMEVYTDPPPIASSHKPRDGVSDQASSHEELLKSLKLPQSHKITAPWFYDVSHSREMVKRRERRLKADENENVRSALRTLSDKENVIERAATMKEIGEAQETRRRPAPVLTAAVPSTGLTQVSAANGYCSEYRQHHIVSPTEDTSTRTNAPRPCHQ
ncbi:MAG: hypothetical protein J3Q66DRAFT_398444 [Benniella sp.]|nr:MAG: hypothetical protein J3Q66DRAFT_398444 [Benniella sp.]